MDNKNKILLLGQNRVGRNTLFVESQLGFVKTDHDQYIIWENKQTQFIIPKQSLNKQTVDAFFKVMEQQASLQTFQLIVCCIDIPNLADTSLREHCITELNTSLDLIKSTQKKLPVAIAVTQCDRLLGFQEYFTNLTQSERNKTLSVNQLSELEPLLKDLNTQIISRLHQEPLPQKRALIQIFPAQFEKMSEYLDEFVIGISHHHHMQLLGIYFTSCKQKHKPMDLLTSQNSDLPPSLTHKLFFSEGLIIHLSSLATQNKIKAKRFDKKRWAIIPIALIVVVALVISWHSSYQKTIQTFKQIQAQLQQKPKPSANQPAWMAYLSMLNRSLVRLRSPAVHYGTIIGFSQVKRLRKHIELLYHTQLQIHFLPYIEGILTNAMVNGMQHNKLQLYNALKIYLILTTNKHYDANTVTNWFQLYWHKADTKNPKLEHQLLTHLKQLLQLKNNWPLNKPLIAEAQQILQALPTADIAFLELQGLYKNKNESLSDMLQNHDDIDLSHAIIPSLYSSNNFKQIYETQIPQLVAKVNQSDWVIGHETATKPSGNEQTQLITEVRELYLSYFSKNWGQMLNQIQFIKPQNFADIQTSIDEISNPKSSFNGLLKFIIGNAMLDKQVSPSTAVQNVNNFLDQGTLYKSSSAELKNLSLYLKTIVSSQDIQLASYNTVASLLNNPNQPNPIHDLLNLPSSHNPISQWLKLIAQNSLHILLTNSSQHLNKLWATNIYPNYADNLKNHYPVFTASSDNSTLDDFDQFFSPNGSIDTFFNYYLKPFVNMKKSYWNWQSLYGIKIPSPQKTLDMFMRASLIQQMFYSNDHKHLSFKFSLVPFAKSDSVRSVSITSDGQNNLFSNKHNDSTIFNWPGKNANNKTTLLLKLNNGDSLTRVFDGPWALFRMLDFATVTSTTNPQKYIVQFKIDKYKVTYNMIMDNKVNPFLPGVLTQYRIDENPF